MTIRLIVGLCNPGAMYARTRHNAGDWLIDAIAAQYQGVFKVEKKWHGECADVVIAGQTCKLFRPLVFMNQNGLAIKAVSQFYRIMPQEILVAHDELDLPVGRLKIKIGGGHGGHNGLRDLIQQLGHTEFHRIRIGIGHPGDKALVLDYVLGKPSPHDYALMMEAIRRGLSCLPTIVSGQMAKAMNQLNG